MICKITIIAFASLLFASCEKGLLAGRKFKWVENGSRFFYDYYTPADTIKDARTLTVWEEFHEEDPSNPTYYQNYFRLTQSDLVVKKDGLYIMELERCSGMGIISSTKKIDFLYAPDDPDVGDLVPEYGCGGTPYSYTNTITEVNKMITVPAGTYKTYVMKLFNGDLVYWDPDNGIIMYDRYDQNGSLIGSLKLNRIQG